MLMLDVLWYFACGERGKGAWNQPGSNVLISDLLKKVNRFAFSCHRIMKLRFLRYVLRTLSFPIAVAHTCYIKMALRSPISNFFSNIFVIMLNKKQLSKCNRA